MRSTNSPDRVTAEQRRLAALELRRDGATYGAIGQALGCDKSTAYRAVSSAMVQLREDTRAEAALLRAEVTGDLLAIQMTALNAWARFEGLDDADGTPLDAKGAPLLRTALRAIEGIRKLHGLDAPTAITVAPARDPLNDMSEDEARAILAECENIPLDHPPRQLVAATTERSNPE
jgi:Homeodomain-like domain